MDSDQLTAFSKKAHATIATDAWIKYVVMTTLVTVFLATMLVTL